MKKLVVLSTLLVAICTASFAQRNNGEMVINTENIQKALTGNWSMVNIQPKDADAKIRDISIKGVGYGEVMKVGEDGKQKPVICKIYAQNNGEVIFSDAEGYRVSYKVVGLTKNTMRLSDGKVTLDYRK